MSAEAVEASGGDDGPDQPPRILAETVTVGPSGSARGLLGSTLASEGWREHLTSWSPRPGGGRWLVDAAWSAELRGSGGGHFPAARKWRAALDQHGPVTVVVNAAESEWLSAKDAAVLGLHPHLVLDGAALLAETVGATRTVVWLHESALPMRRSVAVACRERRAHGDPEPPVDIIMAAPGGYLSGESSAIKSALRGGPVLPQFQATRGSGGDVEILVHNVETLARLALLARSPSTSRATEARLITVLTPGCGRRVVDVATTVRLAGAVEAAVGRGLEPATPVLLGGYGGRWAHWSDVAELPVAEDALRQQGHSLGPGIVAPLWQTGCGIAVTASIAGYLARSSAGQCGPCLFGLPALAESMTRLANGRARKGELDLFRRDLDAVAGRGACNHPDGAVRLLRSALDVFAADVAVHASGDSCGRPSSGLMPVPGQGS